MIPPLLLAQWKPIAILVVIGSLGAGLLWYRGSAARAEIEVAEFRAAYELLAEHVKVQNNAVEVMAEKAKRAAENGRRARQEASGAMDVARKHADALQRAMAAPRVTSECPAGEATRVVRADLAGS